MFFSSMHSLSKSFSFFILMVLYQKLSLATMYLKIKINFTDSSIILKLVFAYGLSSQNHNKFTLTVTLNRKFCVKDAFNNPPASATIPHVQFLSCCIRIPYIKRYHSHIKYIYHMSQKANQILWIISFSVQ